MIFCENVENTKSVIPDLLLYQIGGKLLQVIAGRFVDESIARISSGDESADMSVKEAANVSLLVGHIRNFDSLKGDMEYMTRYTKDWKTLLAVASILDEKQSLKSLTEELDSGAYDMFDGETIKLFIRLMYRMLKCQ